jgi:hypothetical protein
MMIEWVNLRCIVNITMYPPVQVLYAQKNKQMVLEKLNICM